jgi:hypothetical protein
MNKDLEKIEAAIDALIDLEGIISDEHYRSLLAKLNSAASDMQEEK